MQLALLLVALMMWLLLLIFNRFTKRLRARWRARGKDWWFHQCALAEGPSCIGEPPLRSHSDPRDADQR